MPQKLVRESAVLHELVNFDDHVDTIAEAPFSMYWGVSKPGTPEFQEFLKDPYRAIQDRIGIPADYQVHTTILGHQTNFQMAGVCANIIVLPAERLVHMTLF